jgi:hypothetical protein
MAKDSSMVLIGLEKLTAAHIDSSMVVGVPNSAQPLLAHLLKVTLIMGSLFSISPFGTAWFCL